MYMIISEIRNNLSKDVIILNYFNSICCIDISDNFHHKDMCESYFEAMMLAFNSFKGKINGKNFHNFYNFKFEFHFY